MTYSDPTWLRRAKCKQVFLLTEEELAQLPDRHPDTVDIANTRKVHKTFFPEKADNEAGEVAVAICSSCPVQLECLRYSLESSQGIGIWGGTSGRTRRRIRRMRKIYQLSGKFVPIESDEYEAAED